MVARMGSGEFWSCSRYFFSSCDLERDLERNRIVARRTRGAYGMVRGAFSRKHPGDS